MCVLKVLLRVYKYHKNDFNEIKKKSDKRGIINCFVRIYYINRIYKKIYE